MSERPTPLKTVTVEHLRVEIYATRSEMGAAAASDVATRMWQLCAHQLRVRTVFAAAPSQNEFLAALGSAPRVGWPRVEAFHMDEYVGLPPDAPRVSASSCARASSGV